MRPFHQLFNSGTSEGVKKGWESRRTGSRFNEYGDGVHPSVAGRHVTEFQNDGLGLQELKTKLAAHKESKEPEEGERGEWTQATKREMQKRFGEFPGVKPDHFYMNPRQGSMHPKDVDSSYTELAGAAQKATEHANLKSQQAADGLRGFPEQKHVDAERAHSAAKEAHGAALNASPLNGTEEREHKAAILEHDNMRSDHQTAAARLRR